MAHHTHVPDEDSPDLEVELLVVVPCNQVELLYEAVRCESDCYLITVCHIRHTPQDFFEKLDFIVFQRGWWLLRCCLWYEILLQVTLEDMSDVVLGVEALVDVLFIFGRDIVKRPQCLTEDLESFLSFVPILDELFAYRGLENGHQLSKRLRVQH